MAPVPNPTDLAVQEMSKRVDATHVLLYELDSRVEANRQHMDERFDRVIEGMGVLAAAQARQQGHEEGVHTVTYEVDRKTQRRLQWRANAIGLASVTSVVLSTAATFFAAMHG